MSNSIFISVVFSFRGLIVNVRRWRRIYLISYYIINELPDLVFADTLTLWTACFLVKCLCLFSEKHFEDRTVSSATAALVSLLLQFVSTSQIFFLFSGCLFLFLVAKVSMSLCLVSKCWLPLPRTKKWYQLDSMKHKHVFVFPSFIKFTFFLDILLGCYFYLAYTESSRVTAMYW